MDLVTPAVHLSLTYVDVLNRAGVTLTDASLDAYGQSPHLVEPVTTYGIAAMMQQMSRLGFNSASETIPGETMSGYLRRVVWLEGSGSDCRLSAMGRAVLNHANRPVADSEEASVSVVIDPEDPLAYLRIFDLINEHDGGLLVDPYLKLPGLSDLLEISTVTRVLTAVEGRNAAIFSRAIAATGSPLEARSVPQVRLHDRFFIATEAVYVLGSSLNSITKRPGVVTPISDTNAVTAISSTYEALWSEGVPLVVDEDSDGQEGQVPVHAG